LDGGPVGYFFSQNILQQSNSGVVWSKYPGENFPSIDQLENDITEERIWVIVAGMLPSNARSRM
jgi:hypothetical protein